MGHNIRVQISEKFPTTNFWKRNQKNYFIYRRLKMEKPTNQTSKLRQKMKKPKKEMDDCYNKNYRTLKKEILTNQINEWFTYSWTS